MVTHFPLPRYSFAQQALPILPQQRDDFPTFPHLPGTEISLEFVIVTDDLAFFFLLYSPQNVIILRGLHIGSSSLTAPTMRYETEVRWKHGPRHIRRDSD